MFPNPNQNLSILGLREGMVVCDFGSGSGFYTKVASRKVGHTGHVYAIEIQKDLVKKLENDFKNQKIKNVSCIWGDVENIGGSKLKDNSVDMVIISNLIFQVDDKIGVIDEAKRILKKGGKVLLVDWHEHYHFVHKGNHVILRKDNIEELFIKRGFKVIENINNLDHHYGIIFEYER